MSKERNVSIDFIRVLASVFVVAIHTPMRPFAANGIFQIFLSSTLLVANGWFYMISGYFNLAKKFSSGRDMVEFYLKRFISIFLPFMGVALIMYLVDAADMGVAPTALGYYREIMETGASTHLWFLYFLVGFVMSTPILAKALNGMSRGEMKVVFAVGIGWNVLKILLGENFDIIFSYHGWILGEWGFIYVAGFLCRKLINEHNEGKLYGLGVICFAISIICLILIPQNYKYPFDLSPTYTIYAIASCVFLSRKLVFRNLQLKRIIIFLSEQSYFIYLFHWIVQHKLLPFFPMNQIPWISVRYALSILIVYVISLGCAVVYQKLIMGPLSMLMNRGLKRLMSSPANEKLPDNL